VRSSRLRAALVALRAVERVLQLGEFRVLPTHLTGNGK
jgi:hypothetical protein